MSTDYATVKDEPSSVEPPPPPSPTSKSHSCLRDYCICSSCLAVLLGFTALIVTLIALAYRLRSPRMTIDSISIAPSNLNKGSLASNNKLSVATDFSIKNRDGEPFRFDGVRASLLYRGREMGSAEAPAGKVRGHRTFRGNLKLDASADRMLNDPSWAEDLKAGSVAALEVSTETVGGRIRSWTKRRGGSWRLYDRRADAGVKCTVTVSVPSLAVLSRVCQ